MWGLERSGLEFCVRSPKADDAFSEETATARYSPLLQPPREPAPRTCVAGATAHHVTPGLTGTPPVLRPESEALRGVTTYGYGDSDPGEVVGLNLSTVTNHAMSSGRGFWVNQVTDFTPRFVNIPPGPKLTPRPPPDN